MVSKTIIILIKYILKNYVKPKYMSVIAINLIVKNCIDKEYLFLYNIYSFPYTNYYIVVEYLN